MKYKKVKLIKHWTIFVVMSFIMGVMWLSWFRITEIDPVKITLPLWIKWSGFIIFIIGTVIFLVGIMQIIYSYIKSKILKRNQLITNGIFSFLRHPMYAGFILWILGYPIFQQALITFFTGIIWIPNIILWIKLEEKELYEEFHDYENYAKKVKFL